MTKKTEDFNIILNIYRKEEEERENYDLFCNEVLNYGYHAFLIDCIHTLTENLPMDKAMRTYFHISLILAKNIEK